MSSTFIETWLNYRSEALIIMTITIIIQFLIILLLLLYAVLFHHLQIKKEVQQKQKNAFWYDVLFRYFEGEIEIATMKKRIPKRDYPYFLEFMKHFLMDIQGTEKEQATQLLLALSFDRYLIEQLNKRDESNRVYAVYFLGLMGDRQSLAQIRELIRDRSGVIRLMAASALMQLQDTKSIPVILEELGQQGDREYKSHLISHLMEFGSGMLAELERIFRTQDLIPWVTEACLDIFGYYVYVNVTDKILALLYNDPDIEIRIAAVRALSRFEDPTLLDFFEIQLNNGNYAIQAYSARALGLIGDPQAIPYLKKTVFSPDFWVVKRSVEALHRLGGEGSDTLYQILTENHSDRINHLIIEAQTA